MLRELFYLAWGYLSGSVLFAVIFSQLFHKDVTADSKDKNPGAANAFMYGGFWCGVLTLAGDILKGFVPIACYFYTLPNGLPTPLTPFILCAPVIGHVFPVTRHFRGGKGIATSFGCLLGFAPICWTPVVVLAVIFVFYSIFLRITPNLARTIVTYVTLPPGLILMHMPAWICLGALCMSCTVILRLHLSKEEREKTAVHLLWWT